jgi:hypothetical protein
MPWRIRKQITLILLGAAVMALAVVVFVLNRDTSSDILAVVALLGGLAILVNSLPTNGEKKE